MISYDIVAVSMPIVYTLDGDHDPNGMLFVTRAHLPLLQWARDRWNDGGERLLRLHTRRQLVQIVVDGLGLLEQQLDRLHHGPDEDQDLLAELIRQEYVPELGEPGDRLAHGARRRSNRAGAVRRNMETTLEELRTALEHLGVDQLGPAADGDGGGVEVEVEVEEAEIGTRLRLVSLSPAERAAGVRRWKGQLELLDGAIATWFTDLDADPERSLEGRMPCLEEKSGLDAATIRRLLLNDHSFDVRPLGAGAPDHDRFNPMKPIPLIQPLVLRAHVGEEMRVTVENQLESRARLGEEMRVTVENQMKSGEPTPTRRLGFHVQGDGLGSPSGRGVEYGDGAHYGGNADTTIAPGARREFVYRNLHEGVWPINDLADARGGADGTNVHGLFGAVVVEPAGVTWHDPVTGEDLTGRAHGVGLYVDIHYPDDQERPGAEEHRDFVDFHVDDIVRSFREFTVFIHDEPEIHSGNHLVGEHSVMPLSYRAEPMPNRLPHRMRRYAEATPPSPPPGQVGVDRRAVAITVGEELEEQFRTARTPDGHYLERVLGEEQHHSSWLFGDPITPVLRAYRGDPCRVRLVHAGVKETHVFHLHVHQWRAVPQDTAPPGAHSGAPKGSQLLDSITIGPQTGITIDPLYGSGSRQHAFGDVIWHCHLYPHFHHGMWGLWRSFDRLVDGSRALPDGTPCPALQPLPGRVPEDPEAEHPGFPWFIDGVFPMKSPPPPAAVEAHRSGRRILLDMAPHSPLEGAAMAPGNAGGDRPGAFFVDLDGSAAQWNHRAGLPGTEGGPVPPRVVSYDVEVTAGRVLYNADGWHDPRGHWYRLLRAEVREPQADGTYAVTRREVMEAPTGDQPVPFYPRANHGDVVELRLHNAIGSVPADQFDLGQGPVECGLHVHLVKFDVLCSDGSSTGWNYLSGASCREAVGSDVPGQQRATSLHRWVVDEEFGPCFFHDHLLANYRQKHGLFAALIAEPHGSQWLDGDDQSRIGWAGPDAVVVPPSSSGLPPHREACLGVGDFVTLLDEGGRALNPPTELSGDDDPGSMAVNYRSAPLTHRGPDPSRWFANAARSRPSLAGGPGDPDTPIITAYPGEQLRIRLIQGSHEEQHSFATHGLRWRADWGNPGSMLVDQQSLGISEAFTIEVGGPGEELAYGDHLWRFVAIDDTWTGCWGYVRVLLPTATNFARRSPLPDLVRTPSEAHRRMRDTVAPRPPAPRDDGTYDPAEVRSFVVVARRREHHHTGVHLTDPWGLVFHHAVFDPAEHAAAVAALASDDPVWRPAQERPADDGPLVLRVRAGQWLRVFLVNELLSGDDTRPIEPEPSPPRLPLEHLDEQGWPDERTVSSRVSLHPGLLRYDVTAHDGAHVGRNGDSTVGPRRFRSAGHEADGPAGADHDLDHHDDDGRNWREYWWWADEALAPSSHTEGPGAVCLLQDMADVRNHHHHGLVGAVVVEPPDVEPYRSAVAPVLHPGFRAEGDEGDGWVGREVELRSTGGETAGAVVARESVVFIQDGLRLFVNGHPDQPVPDVAPGDDPEDSGQRAISYRTAAVHRGVPVAHDQWDDPPVLTAEVGDRIWLHVVGAGDKPRQHTLTVHGFAWPVAPWVPDGPWVGGVSGVAPGWARTLDLRAEHPGHHAIRTGAFRWGTELGLWATLRVLAKKARSR